MATVNPYAPPRSSRSDPAPHTDTTDYFVETLPTSKVRIAAVIAFFTGFAMLFMWMRIMLVGQSVLAVSILELVLLGLGGLDLGVAWGLLTGRVVLVVLGMAVSPIALCASAVVFFTGSLAGVTGGALSIANLVLLSTNLATIRTMQRARVQIRALTVP